jgi:serine/threonine protein kinase
MDDMEFCSQDGTRLVAAVTAVEGQLAAGLSRRFRIVRRLGAGGMGTVYLADQIGVGNRPVALKVLNRKLLDDPEFLLRFQNEAGSTGRIHHPNVVTIYEAAQADDGTPYIAMEFLDGQTLRDALSERGALPLDECAEILRQTAHGLNAAHKLGIIHRDLKPDNIFLTQGEGGELVVKVVDFGIAKLRESVTHTITGMVLGTPAYMSSEQAAGIRSDQLDLRSDVYSLGIVVYEMITGSLPFHSETPLGYLRKHMLEPPPPLRTFASGMPVPTPVEAVVMKALAKSRDDRFASALDFSNQFDRAVSSSLPTDTLPVTREVKPFEVTQPAQVPDPVVKGQTERREKEAMGGEILGREKAMRADQARPVTEPDQSKKAKPEPIPVVRKDFRLPPPIPVSAQLPGPRPTPVVVPRLASEPFSIRQVGNEVVAPRPQPAPRPAPHGSGGKVFKVGFWILGISQVLMILENLITTARYRYFSHYQVMNWFGILLEIGVGAGFVVMFCGFLARKRNTLLLWVSLGFAAMGMLANNVFWIALQQQYDYHLSYTFLSLLGMWRVFSISSGLPLSSLIGPIVMAHMGRVFYFAVLVNLDCLLKIGFLIWALAKYGTDSPAAHPSA